MGHRRPYRRYRYELSRILGEDETCLWLDQSRTRHHRLPAWVDRPAGRVEHLFDAAEDEIGVLIHNGAWPADDAGILATLPGKAQAGIRVRLVVGDPDGPDVRPLPEVEGIDVRRYVDAANAPVLRLRRVAGGALVKTYLESFDRIWSQARPMA